MNDWALCTRRNGPSMSIWPISPILDMPCTDLKCAMSTAFSASSCHTVRICFVKRMHSTELLSTASGISHCGPTSGSGWYQNRTSRFRTMVG